MRKVLIVVLALAMVLSLTACGGGSIQDRLEKVEKGMKVEEAIKILGDDYEEIVFEYKYAGESFIVYAQEDNTAAVVYTVDDEVDSVEWVEDYALWRENANIVVAKDLDGEEISGMTVQEATAMFGDDYEEIVFEHKYAGESYLVYEKGNNGAIVVHAEDSDVTSVQWVEDYALWRETADFMILDDTAGMEISVDEFFKRYNEIIKEYDYDFLVPLDKSDFEAADDVDMNNVDYAYEYYYNGDEYTITYYTDENDRLLYLLVAIEIDLDQDVDANAAEHGDLFNIITRAAIGRVVSEASLDEVTHIEDYGVYHTYSGRYYGVLIRHTDTE